MPLVRSVQILHPGYLASRFYPLARSGGSLATIGAVDTIYFYYFLCPAPITWTAVQARVGTGGAGSSMKSGIWADSPVSHRPLGAPLYVDNTGQATTTSSSYVTPAWGAGSLLANTGYWIGSKFTGTLPQMLCESSVEVSAIAMSGTLTGINAAALTYADAYANSLPTFIEGATFTSAQQGAPIIGAVT